MPLRRRVHQPIGSWLKQTRKRRRKVIFLLTMLLIFALIIDICFCLHKLFCQIALSDAEDRITVMVSNTVKGIMNSGEYDYDYFVSLEKDNSGNITAISANMAGINDLAAELISRLADASSTVSFDVGVPVGNLLGISFLLNKGPVIPAKVTMMTSSGISFSNELVSSGINQSKHLITLRVHVNVSVIVPWAVVSSGVDTDVLVAETVIVGRVPDTYVNLEDINGR